MGWVWIDINLVWIDWVWNVYVCEMIGYLKMWVGMLYLFDEDVGRDKNIVV